MPAARNWLGSASPLETCYVEEVKAGEMKQVGSARLPGYLSITVLVRHDFSVNGRAGAIWALGLPIVLELNSLIPVRIGHLGSSKLQLLNVSMNNAT
jgi:hypothetical protein